MLKHRGFPGRLTGTDFQFVIRRANHKTGPTKLTMRERYKDRKLADRQADVGFMGALWAHFGEEPFELAAFDFHQTGVAEQIFSKHQITAAPKYLPRNIVFLGFLN